MRCAPRASNGPDHLGLRALQLHTQMMASRRIKWWDGPRGGTEMSNTGAKRFQKPLTRDCHFAGALSPSLLIHLLKGEGGVQQNDGTLVNGAGSRR